MLSFTVSWCSAFTNVNLGQRQQTSRPFNDGKEPTVQHVPKVHHDSPGINQFAHEHIQVTESQHFSQEFMMLSKPGEGNSHNTDVLKNVSHCSSPFESRIFIHIHTFDWGKNSVFIFKWIIFMYFFELLSLVHFRYP